MDVKKVIAELQRLFPGKTMVENKNSLGVTTEVVCEKDPTENHADYSESIAVVDASTIHYHKKLTEKYEIMKGDLEVFKYDANKLLYKEYKLKKGEMITIHPGEIHSCKGDETWVKVVSKPGWTPGDYINLETIIKKYLKKA